jgi:hypothetical protein
LSDKGTFTTNASSLSQQFLAIHFSYTIDDVGVTDIVGVVVKLGDAAILGVTDIVGVVLIVGVGVGVACSV